MIIIILKLLATLTLLTTLKSTALAGVCRPRLTSEKKPGWFCLFRQGAWRRAALGFSAWRLRLEGRFAAVGLCVFYSMFGHILAALARPSIRKKSFRTKSHILKARPLNTKAVWLRCGLEGFCPNALFTLHVSSRLFCGLATCPSCAVLSCEVEICGHARYQAKGFYAKSWLFNPQRVERLM